MVTRRRRVPLERLTVIIIAANLFVIIVLLMLVVLDYPSSARKFIAACITDSNDQATYAMEISETGSQYRLEFNGGFFPGGGLTGIIEELNAELYMEEGRLYVSASDSPWQPVEEIEMDSMYALVYNPLVMLDEMVSEPGAIISFGPSENVDGVLAQRVNIKVPQQSLPEYYTSYFAMDKGIPQFITIYAWFDSKENTLLKLQLDMQYELGDKQFEILRVIDLLPGGAVPVIEMKQ